MTTPTNSYATAILCDKYVIMNHVQVVNCCGGQSKTIKFLVATKQWGSPQANTISPWSAPRRLHYYTRFRRLIDFLGDYVQFRLTSMPKPMQRREKSLPACSSTLILCTAHQWHESHQLTADPRNDLATEFNLLQIGSSSPSPNRASSAQVDDSVWVFTKRVCNRRVVCCDWNFFM